MGGTFGFIADDYPLVITVNGVTRVNSNACWGGNGFLEVAVGDIIGLASGLLSDNLSHTGANPVGSMYAWLNESLEPVNPVPIPGSLILFTSGMIGMIGFRRWGWRR